MHNVSKGKRRRPAPRAEPPSIWQRGKWWFIGGGIVGAVALLAILSSSFSGGGTASGETAPDITLATAAGEFQLSEQRGEVTLLYFSFPG